MPTTRPRRVEARSPPGPRAAAAATGPASAGSTGPAGEGGLAGVRAQVRRALGEQHVGAVRTLAEQQEHGGAPVVAGRRGESG